MESWNWCCLCVQEIRTREVYRYAGVNLMLCGNLSRKTSRTGWRNWCRVSWELMNWCILCSCWSTVVLVLIVVDELHLSSIKRTAMFYDVSKFCRRTTCTTTHTHNMWLERCTLTKYSPRATVNNRLFTPTRPGRGSLPKIHREMGTKILVT